MPDFGNTAVLDLALVSMLGLRAPTAFLFILGVLVSVVLFFKVISYLSLISEMVLS